MTLSNLDEIAKYLEQHEHSKRIKKLIFSVCKNTWENDQTILDSFKFPELIQELCHLNPTIDNLNSTLSNVVNTLNKPGEYSIVASIIINEIQKLYLMFDEETKILPNQPIEEETGIIFQPSHPNYPILSKLEQASPNFIKKPPVILQKIPYNQFDLRQNIMKYTNPLRAKIVLFSALYYKFSFNKQDWFKLRTETLDTLLQKLFDSCPNIREFESKINKAVISLGKPNENTQAGSAIIQSMRRFYSEMPAEDNLDQPIYNDPSQVTKTLVNANYEIALADMDDFLDNSDEDNSTCQLIEPPTKDHK